MAKIRKLTGKAAEQYYDDFHATDVVPYINPINYFFAELRAKILEHLGVKLEYFDYRHRLPPNEMSIFDQMYVGLYGLKYLENLVPKYSVHTLRYKYLAHKYKPNYARKEEWITVSPPGATKTVYVWHEDIDEYKKQ